MAFLKLIFVMRYFKIILAAFSVMALLFFVSCDTEETNKTDSDNSIELNELDTTSVQKRPEGEMVYRSVSYNEDNKEAVLSELIESFTEYLYVDLGFDSQEEVAFIELENHLKNKEYVLKYDFMRAVDMLFTFAITGTAWELLEPDKEQLELICNGGTNDGKSIKVDKPKSMFSKAATEIYKFSIDCLNGGGCVKMCTVSIAITSIVLKTSDPNVTE